jgi:hypothetical protein
VLSAAAAVERQGVFYAIRPKAVPRQNGLTKSITNNIPNKQNSQLVANTSKPDIKSVRHNTNHVNTYYAGHSRCLLLE